MSLSQKHSGKVLVPWFNAAEWEFVHDLIIADNLESQTKAVEVLRIWKIRTPLLSAGLEGSLILLETLTADKTKLSNSQLIQVLSVALLRFLNICATNNDKQGTFNKEAIKQNLPKWIINIRHDIAHNHKLPSAFLLEKSLLFCFDWLKEKYWKEQSNVLNNYVIDDVYINLKRVLKVYIDVARVSYSKAKYSEKLRKEIRSILSVREDFNYKNSLNALEARLKRGLQLCDPKDLFHILVSRKVFFYENAVEGGRISEKQRSLWSNLLNILQECRLLFSVIDALFSQFVSMEAADKSRRLLASTWIYEIILGYSKHKLVNDKLSNNSDGHELGETQMTIQEIVDKNPIFEDVLDFEPTLPVPTKEAEQFQEKVLSNPNEFNEIFLEELLKFNGLSEVSISQITELTDKYMSSVRYPIIQDEIYTVKDLKNFDFLTNNNMDVDVDQTDFVNKTSNNSTSKTDWSLIKDTSGFKDCPLGVLPNQSRNVNPCFGVWPFQV